MQELQLYLAQHLALIFRFFGGKKIRVLFPNLTMSSGISPVFFNIKSMFLKLMTKPFSYTFPLHRRASSHLYFFNRFPEFLGKF